MNKWNHNLDIDDEVDDETSSESQQVPVSCVSSKVDPTTSEVTVVECLSPALFYTQTELQWQACNELTQGLNNALREQVELQVSSSVLLDVKVIMWVLSFLFRSVIFPDQGLTFISTSYIHFFLFTISSFSKPASSMSSIMHYL